MRAKRPARGSHLPGSFYYYNNWDFNVLATIFEKLTGKKIFEEFAQRIAAPIGMEDYTLADGQFVARQHPLVEGDSIILTTPSR
jgi:CubicO group peptidase (beta-lactamase class C family)